MYAIDPIQFDELGVSIGDVEGFCLAGRFEIDSGGVIRSIEVDDWTGRRHGTQYINGDSTGIARLLWLLVCPLLKQRYADRIGEELAEFYSADEIAARAADYHREEAAL